MNVKKPKHGKYGMSDDSADDDSDNDDEDDDEISTGNLKGKPKNIKKRKGVVYKEKIMWKK